MYLNLPNENKKIIDFISKECYIIIPFDAFGRYLEYRNLAEMGTNDEIRKNIVETSRKIFAKFGFKKTTMWDIANSVSKAKSTIYHYFKSKNDIFKAVIEKEFYMLKQRILKSINAVAEPERKIYLYTITKINGAKEFNNLYSVILNEYSNEYVFLKGVIEKIKEEEIIVLRNIIEEGIKTGKFFINNVESVVDSIFFTIKGLEIQSQLSNGFKLSSEKIGNVVKLIIHGITKK